jgi:hypothetical protein
VLTLNQIVSQITNLAAAHNQIAESGVGDFAEWQAKERSYPILWVFHESTAVSQMEIAFSIRLICADRVIVGEEGDDTQGHEQEVISDTLLVLLDFLAYFQQNHSQPYDVVTSATIDPFTERLNDRLAGNSVTITIRQPFDWNKCQIPQTGASIPPTVDGLTLYNFCDPAVIARLTDEQVACLQSEYALPATITINSAPFASVPSGGSLNVPVKNSAGTLRGSKIGADWVVPDGSVPVTNTAATPITTIAVPSGNNVPYVIPNVAWTDSDGSAESTPYGDAIVCTLTPTLAVTVSDDTPNVGDTITITATPTGFSPNNYLFFVQQGGSITQIGSQVGGVLNWTVTLNGTFKIFAQADNGTAGAFNVGGSSVTSTAVVITTNIQLYQDPFRSNVVPPSYPDLSPFLRTGTMINSPTFVAGTLAANGGGYTEMNGVNQYISVGSVSDFSFIQNTFQFSIMGFFRIPSGVSDNLLMGTSITSVEKGFFISVNSTLGGTGRIRMSIFNGSGSQTITSDNNVTPSTAWYHIAIVGTGSTTYQIYMNGVAITTNIGGAIAAATGNSARVLNIGRGLITGFEFFFNGRVGPLQIYNAPLSAADVLNNFNVDRSRYGL